jgi:hypothetical protein
LAKLSEKQLEQIREIVYSDTPEGFIWFYYFIAPTEWPLPRHCVYWVVKFYEARDKGMNLAVEAFRGSLKSTVFSIYMTAYQTALHPDLETVIVQASEGLANDNSAAISNIFEHNAGFRILFPHILPDKPQGWGAKGGYEIQNTDMDYSAFRKLRTVSPSVLATTYKSANVQGRHPRLFGILDDINNSKNSRYPRELQTVKLAVDQEILPAFDRVMMRIDVFTPWREGDIGDTAKKQDDTLHIRTPIYKLDENGQLTDEPVWPEKKSRAEIERIRNRVAPHVFAQMQLCDLKGAEGRILKREYLKYIEVDEIPPDIKVYIACDYASVAKDQALIGRDYFALAVVGHHPSGFLILLDGVRKHVDRAEAEQIFMNWCSMYHKKGRLIRAGIETHGKGEEFADYMMRAAQGWKVKQLTTGNRSKGERFENQLAPVMMGDRFRLTTAPGAFIDQFVDEYLSYDGMGTYTDDTLDAVYYAVRLAKGFIKWTDDDSMYGGVVEKIRSSNPLHKLARRRNATTRPEVVQRSR